MTYDPNKKITPLEKLLFIKECLLHDRDVLMNHLELVIAYLNDLTQHLINTEAEHQRKLLQLGEVICRQCKPNLVLPLTEIKQHDALKHNAYNKVV